MEKILDIINSIAYEKGISVENTTEAIKDALIMTAKKTIDQDMEFSADIDEESKELKLFQMIEVVEDDTEGLDEQIEGKEKYITLTVAKTMDPDLEVGDKINYDLEFENLGRTFSTRLYKEMEFKIQRTIEDGIFNKYKEKVGSIINARVVRVDEHENTYVEMGEVKGIMSRKNRIKGETFKVGDVIRALVKSVRVEKAHGLVVEISRTSPRFLEALLFMEVPEIEDGIITIHGCARIPGERAKIALSSSDPKVDPIGSVVGAKGVRITSVSDVLNGENIDCIEFSPIKEMYISRALSPAIVASIVLTKNPNEDERDSAIISITSDQKARAIGKKGFNIRLTSMLTKTDIEINELEAPAISEIDSDDEGSSDGKSTDLTSLSSLFKD